MASNYHRELELLGVSRNRWDEVGRSVVAERRNAAMARRSQAWTYMVEAAEKRFHGMDHAAILRVMGQNKFRNTYGIGKRELAAKFDTRVGTLTTLDSILADLITIGGEGESPAPVKETFEKFRDIKLAEKRTRNMRTTYRPWHAQVENTAE